MDDVPAAVVGRILSFLELRWLLSFRLLNKAFCRTITESQAFRARWLSILGPMLEALYEKALSMDPSLSPGEFAIKFGKETGRWRRRAFASSTVLPLPEEVQRASTKNMPAMRDAHRLFSKAVSLSDVRERALLAGILGCESSVVIPLMMEERPQRNGRLHVMWPALGVSQTFRFGKTLGLLPPATSAAIDPPSPVTYPEVSWIVDKNCRRILVNWSAVHMYGNDIHCRLSVHEIDPQGPFSMPPSTQLFCFPLRASVTALAGIVVQQDLLVAVGTSDGEVWVVQGPDQPGVIETGHYLVSRREGHGVKTLTLTEPEPGLIQLFVTTADTVRVFVKEESEWRLILDGMTTADHQCVNFVCASNQLCISVPSATRPFALIDLLILRRNKEPCSGLDLGTFVIFVGQPGPANFQDPDSCPWFAPYRVNRRPEYFEYIASLNLWIIALDSCLKLVRLDSGSVRLVSILNSAERVYIGRSDGMFRYTSVDVSEVVTVWDLRRRCKLMQFDLLSCPLIESEDDTPTRTSYTVIDSPVVSPAPIAASDAFPALPSPAIPLQPVVRSAWGPKTREIVGLAGAEGCTRLCDAGEGSLTPMDSPIQRAARSYADRSHKTDLELATEEYGRQLGLTKAELELYHQSLLELDVGPSNDLSPHDVGDLAKEDQMPVPQWLQEQKDELDSLSAKKSSSSKTDVAPMESVLAHKLHGTGRAPGNIVIEPIEMGSGSHRKISKVQSLGHLMNRKQKTRLLLDEDAEGASCSELLQRSKRAVTDVSMGPTHLALYFGCLATWQVWKM